MMTKKSLLIVIGEEIEKFINILNEDYFEPDWDFSESYYNVSEKIFMDFLFKNNSDFTKTIPWKVVPFSRLKKIWEDYMRTGVVRDERGLEMIEDVITENILKIYIITLLSGHMSSRPDEELENGIGYFIDRFMESYLKNKNRLDNNTLYDYLRKYLEDNFDDDEIKRNPDEVRDKLYEHILDMFFDYYCVDPKTLHLYISDYGLEYLMSYLFQLKNTTKPEEKIIILDKILNVAHQRSDLAGWFVEGGSRALSTLSGEISTVED